MTRATISLNRFYSSISESLKKRYEERYPSHEVALEVTDCEDLKPKLILNRLPASNVPGAAHSDREEKEFLYRVFLEEFLVEHGMYPWEMPR